MKMTGQKLKHAGPSQGHTMVTINANFVFGILLLFTAQAAFAQTAVVKPRTIWEEERRDTDGNLLPQSSMQMSVDVNDALKQIVVNSASLSQTVELDLNGMQAQCGDGQAVQAPAQDAVKASGAEFSIKHTEQAYQRGKRVPYSEANFDAYINNYVEAYYGNLKLSLKEMQAKFIAVEMSNKVPYSSQEMFDAYLRSRIIKGSIDERNALLKEAAQLMTFEHQLSFVSKLGGNAVANYDSEREAAGVKANTAVSCDAILSNLNKRNPLGVCRDITMCQAQLLEKMGNKDNVYMVAYATPGNYHVTLVASDPSNPKIVHKISYDNQMIEDRLRGVSALSQDHSLPDVGITYRIFKPNGEMIASLPSEMGLVLNTHTGGKNARDFDPFIQDQSSMTTVGFGKDIKGSVFNGKLSNGDEVVGIAGHKAWDNYLIGSEADGGISHNGRVGAALANRKIQTGPEADPNRKINHEINQLYVVGEEEIAVDQKLGEKTKVGAYVRGKGAATGIASEREPVGVSDPKFTGDADLTVDYGVRVESKINDGKTKIAADAHRQSTLGLTNISALSGSEVNVPVNHDAYNASVEHSYSEGMDILADATYVSREYGNSGEVNAGVRLKEGATETTIVAGYYTPVGKKAQGWQPGGADPGFSARISRQVSSGDVDANAGITFFRGNAGTWYVGSEFGIKWR